MLSPAWLLVSGAIAAEAAAALLLRRAEGFQRPLPGLLALGAFGLAFYLVSLALVDLPVSIVYPVWAGGGTASVALLGVAWLGERGNASKLAGIALVVVGMVLLNLAAPGA
jgi:small multidrug resistance pump